MRSKKLNQECKGDQILNSNYEIKLNLTILCKEKIAIGLIDQVIDFLNAKTDHTHGDAKINNLSDKVYKNKLEKLKNKGKKDE